MTFSCLIAGVGGQGTVLASKLLAAAAIRSGYEARTAETIGMAQRGGSVVSHVRTGGEVFSPLIPHGGADLLIGFDPSEAVRQLHFLGENGKVFVAGGGEEMTAFLKENVKNTAVIPVGPIKEKYAKMLNTAMLGAAAEGGAFPFDTGVLLETISEIPRYREENMKAFELGRELYREQY